MHVCLDPVFYSCIYPWMHVVRVRACIIFLYLSVILSTFYIISTAVGFGQERTMMAVLGSKPFVLNLPTNELLSQDVEHVDVAKTPRNSFV